MLTRKLFGQLQSDGWLLLFPLLLLLLVAIAAPVLLYRTTAQVAAAVTPPRAVPAAPAPFAQPEPMRVVGVDTALSVVCYEVQGQVSCVWVQSAAKVRAQLGLD